MLALCFAHAHGAGDPARGAELYEARCTGCHSLDANRIGPMHRRVVGRKAGSVRDYAYSPALGKSKLTWSEANLDRWLANPEALVPGQKMGYSVPESADRADIIAYLRRETSTP
ncbi:MAG: c-type cytochrome [Burkholderiales bacterium]|nr:c-type cytochrome [Burkholderiales bacterium]